MGDDLRLDVLGQEQTFVIRGLIYDAEHVITAKDVTPEPAKYGYAVICWNAVPQLPLNEAVARLEAGADRDQVERALQDLLPQALILTQQTHASTQRTRADVDIFQNLTLVFPILAYLVLPMVVLTTLTRMIENQRTQMGTLKALGYRDGQIRRHYLCYALVPSSVGALLGTLVGHYTLPDMLYAMETAHYFLPVKLRAPVSLPAWGMTLLMVLLSMGICMHAYNHAAQEVTAELLRPKPPKSGSRVLLERWGGLWGRFSFNTKMVVRNIARNRWRTLMSMIGVLCCNMLIICAMGLQDSVDACVGEYYTGIWAMTCGRIWIPPPPARWKLPQPPGCRRGGGRDGAVREPAQRGYQPHGAAHRYGGKPDHAALRHRKHGDSPHRGGPGHQPQAHGRDGPVPGDQVELWFPGRMSPKPWCWPRWWIPP